MDSSRLKSQSSEAGTGSSVLSRWIWKLQRVKSEEGKKKWEEERKEEWKRRGIGTFVPIRLEVEEKVEEIKGGNEVILDAASEKEEENGKVTEKK